MNLRFSCSFSPVSLLCFALLTSGAGASDQIPPTISPRVGEPGDPRLLRHLQTIRLGRLRIGPDLHRTVITEIPRNLHGPLQKLGLTPLFALPPKQ